MPTPGYWVECSRQKIALNQHQYWDDSESENEESRDGQLERECSDLYEDDENSDHVPRYAYNKNL